MILGCALKLKVTMCAGGVATEIHGVYEHGGLIVDYLRTSKYCVLVSE